MHSAQGATVVQRSRDETAEWPVYWGAVWVGALAALAVSLIFGLAAIAVGANQAGPGRGIVRWSDFGMGGLVFGVFGAFLSFVVGGWTASKIAGFRRSEPSMLHGAVVWLLAIPFLIGFAALGAGSFFGTWTGGLAGMPAWVTPGGVAADPTVAAAARNAALGAVTSLLLGLVGGVVGGWMASGEPMSLTAYRARNPAAARPPA